MLCLVCYMANYQAFFALAASEVDLVLPPFSEPLHINNSNARETRLNCILNVLPRRTLAAARTFIVLQAALFGFLRAIFQA